MFLTSMNVCRLARAAASPVSREAGGRPRRGCWAYVGAFFVCLTISCLTVSPAPAQSWFDTFDDGNYADGDPVFWNSNPSSVFPGDYDASSGEFVFRTSPSNDGETMLASVQSLTLQNTGSVRTQARLLDTTAGADGGGNIGPVLFFDRQTVSGYVGAIDGQGTMYLVASNGGEITTLGEFASGFDTTQPTILQLDHDGTFLSLSAWQPGQQQPATPQLVVANTDFTQGTGGLVFLEDNDNDIGVFEYARAATGRIVDGDVNEDGLANALDIDLLVQSFGSPDPLFDLNFDRVADRQDVDFLVRDVLQTEYGDINLDRQVDGQDLQVLQANLFMSDTVWATGDFNGDGLTDGQDFNLWLSHRSPAAGTSVVPEPHSFVLLVSLLGVAVLRRRGMRCAVPR